MISHTFRPAMPSLTEADYDTNHYLVVATIRETVITENNEANHQVDVTIRF